MNVFKTLLWILNKLVLKSTRFVALLQFCASKTEPATSKALLRLPSVCVLTPASPRKKRFQLREAFQRERVRFSIFFEKKKRKIGKWQKLYFSPLLRNSEFGLSGYKKVFWFAKRLLPTFFFSRAGIIWCKKWELGGIKCAKSWFPKNNFAGTWNV